MITIPKAAVKLLGCAATEEGRYSMMGLHVQEYQGDRFRLEATDGKKMAIVQGESDHKSADQPLPVTGDTFNYLIPAEGLKKAMQGMKDGTGISLACQGGVIYLAGNGAVRQLPVLEGRFPDVNLVLPKQPHRFSICVNPFHLIDLLQAAIAFAGQTTTKVAIQFAKTDHPITVITCDEAGHVFDGLIMPFTQK